MIFRDTQEAIVDEDTWYVVQKIRETKHRPIAQGKANPLTGLMFCADCGGEFIKFIATVFKFLLLDYLTAQKRMFSHRAVVYMSFFCFFNSIPTSTTDSINAEKSATGPASNTPIIPKRSGSSRVSGINTKVCLVNANRAPFNDFPIAVKKLEESNCTPFTNTMKR